MQHDSRRFVPKVDFLTTPGFLKGPGSREEAGLPPGTGPAFVVSTLSLMDFEPGTCRMRLKSVHPEVTIEDVISNTGFELVIPDLVDNTDPPNSEELRILREEIDPLKFYI